MGVKDEILKRKKRKVTETTNWGAVVVDVVVIMMASYVYVKTGNWYLFVLLLFTGGYTKKG